MILSNDDIRKAIESGEIEITPRPGVEQYAPSSLDLTLGNSFKVWDESKFKTAGVEINLDLSKQDFITTAKAFLTDLKPLEDGTIVLPPYRVAQFHLLAITHEKVHLKKQAALAARVEGRSSFARLGLTVHLTAPTIQCGFRGPITLEMINVGPFYLKLVPEKTRICQLIFEKVQSEPTEEIKSRFQDQDSPAGKETRKQ